MSNFVHDWLSLLAGKSDARTPTLPAHKQVTAAEYNALVSAVNDLRTECWTGGINVLSFGADRTGTTDAAPAINAAIQSMRTGERNSIVFLPPGKYRLSSPLIVESSMTLQGAGGLFSTRGTVLYPDVGVTAIILACGASSPHGGNASWSTVRDLSIFGPEPYHQWNGPAAHGIHVRANGCTVQNVVIQQMQTHGIAVQGGSEGANANCNRIYGATIYYCGGDGVYFQGADSNAGSTFGCSAVGCGGAGLHDASFLGNAHYQFHTESNEGHAFYVVGDVNQSDLYGCYSEADQVSWICPSAHVWGGDHGAEITGGATTDIGARRNRLVVSELFRAIVPGSHTFVGFRETAQLTVGLNDTVPGSASEVSTSDLGVIVQRPHASAYNRNFLSTYVDVETQTGQLVAGQNALLVPTTDLDSGHLRPVSPGRHVFPEGALLGRSRLHSTSDLAGDWNVGDVCWAPDALPGDPEGQRCVVGGTFGTYAEGCTATTTGGVSAFVLSAASSVLRPGQFITIAGLTRQLLPSARWTPSTPVQNDVYCDCYRVANGGLYRLVTNGITGTAGPAGTTWAETDGTAVWAYCGPSDRAFWTSGAFPTGTGQAISYTAPTFRPVGVVLPTSFPANALLRWSGAAWSAAPERDAVTQADTVIAIPAGAGERITLDLTSTADITFSATPLISAKSAGVEVKLTNAGTHNFIVTDSGTLPGSGVVLATGATVVLAPGNMLVLECRADGTWHETRRVV